jgi:hypothetical protein
MLAAGPRYVAMAAAARVDVGGRIAVRGVTLLAVAAMRPAGLLRMTGRAGRRAGRKGVRLVTGTTGLVARRRRARDQAGLLGVTAGTALGSLAHLVRGVAVAASTLVG